MPVDDRVAAEQSAARRSAWVAAGILLLAAPTFLIRSDWPLGVDGTYLGLLGLVMLIIRWLPHRITRRYPVGIVAKAFAVWSLIAAVSILASTLAERDPLPGAKLVAEHALVLAIFAAGYFVVRIEGWKPGTALLVALIWVPVAAFAMVEAVVGAVMIRRIKALASVNYMAASFAAFAWFLLWRLAYRRPKRVHVAIAEIVLLMLCTFAVLFSGTRSSLLALAVVISAVAGGRLIRFLNRPVIRRRTATAVIPVVIVIGVAFWLAVAYLTAGVNLTALVARFDVQAVMSATEQRIGESWMSGIPEGMRMTALGSPQGYVPTASQSDLSSASLVHPHNILLSIWRFAGIGSLMVFLGFLLLIVRSLRAALRVLKSDDRRELLMLSGFVLILFIYSLISGHYTRHWHLYLSLGLLSGSLDGCRAMVRTG